MKIKTKITLGVGLLFGLIAVLAAVGVWYINALATDSGNVLTDNYDTLSYVQGNANSPRPRRRARRGAGRPILAAPQPATRQHYRTGRAGPDRTRGGGV